MKSQPGSAGLVGALYRDLQLRSLQEPWTAGSGLRDVSKDTWPGGGGTNSPAPACPSLSPHPPPSRASWLWAETPGVWVFVAQRCSIGTWEAASLSEGSSRSVPGQFVLRPSCEVSGRPLGQW